ncbi:MAG TPA: hypothetical protein VFB38_19210 [Chthonomonadaceae bacterium]|nr:hypothetical protein [Chthonomonadaceae bacterium]
MPAQQSGDNLPTTTQENITQAGLPALSGSAEQIAQAESIRTQILMRADDLVSALRAEERLFELPAPHPPPAIGEVEAALQRLRNQADAAWWIAHGPDGAYKLLEASLLQVRAERVAGE